MSSQAPLPLPELTQTFFNYHLDNIQIDLTTLPLSEGDIIVSSSSPLVYLLLYTTRYTCYRKQKSSEYQTPYRDHTNTVQHQSIYLIKTKKVKAMYWPFVSLLEYVCRT